MYIVKSNGPDQYRALETLPSLRRGSAIDPRQDEEHVLQFRISDKINLIKERINNLRNNPPQGDSVFYWILGNPGIGKTQMLLKVYNDIISLRDSESKYKFAVSKVDLKYSKKVGTLSGFQGAIFLNSILGGIGNKTDKVLKEAKAQYELSIIKGNKANEVISSSAEVISLIALLLEMSGGTSVIIPPFGGLILSNMVSKFYVNYRNSKNGIKSRLIKHNKKWLEDKDALDLMVDWLFFCANPTRERSENLINLTSKDTIFDIFCRCLYISGFSTLVIFLDEVGVITSVDFDRWFRRFRNSEIDELQHKLNIIVISSAFD